MILGFTGSRKGLSDFQLTEIEKFISVNVHIITEFHMGDCIAADEQASYIVSKHPSISIISHPPTEEKSRAFFKAHKILPPKKYLDRNKDIVDVSDLIIAAPNGEERQRSGTWSTIRHAKKKNIKIIICFPQGVIESF
jgi:hypothetical protein